MHRNVLSTRLESQEGRDRLKCLAIYVHQKTSSDKSMKDGVQNTWDSLELGSQELKEWRGYVEIGQQYTLESVSYFQYFLFAFKIEEMGSTFCIFSTFFVNISLLLLHIIQRFAATLLKEVNLNNGGNK